MHYADRACYFVQRCFYRIWRCSRSGAYHQRIYIGIWWMGICFYSNCDVLFRIFYDYWLGTLRYPLY